MLRIGILGCAEIAYRRFMPALQNVKDARAVAVAETYAPEKLKAFCDDYGLEGGENFEALLDRTDIDAVYVPQPPALHAKWTLEALRRGKHVLVEKPSSTSYADSLAMVSAAREKGLALHENYMFRYHSQIDAIKKLLADDAVGEIRLIKAAFGFPLRAANDFRYNAGLGGGALLDAGGYTAKLAAMLLGETARVDTAKLVSLPGYEVDMMGSATLSNDEGLVCQIAFGMDCFYQCCLEVWGSKGRLYTNRIFTAPPGYEPQVLIETADGRQEISLEADAHFEHSIEAFIKETVSDTAREKMYQEILHQAMLIEDMRRLA